jgi:hypothetical protein
MWPWFDFPVRPNSQAEMFTLFELHEGRAFIKFSTRVPGHPSVALLQVVTFFDPDGEQRLFTERTRMQFESLANTFHAGLTAPGLKALTEVANERRIVAQIVGVGEEELFMLSPASSARQLCSQIDPVVENPDATFLPLRESSGG